MPQTHLQIIDAVLTFSLERFKGPINRRKLKAVHGRFKKILRVSRVFFAEVPPKYRVNHLMILITTPEFLQAIGSPTG